MERLSGLMIVTSHRSTFTINQFPLRCDQTLRFEFKNLNTKYDEAYKILERCAIMP